MRSNDKSVILDWEHEINKLSEGLCKAASYISLWVYLGSAKSAPFTFIAYLQQRHCNSDTANSLNIAFLIFIGPAASGQ